MSTLSPGEVRLETCPSPPLCDDSSTCTTTRCAACQLVVAGGAMLNLPHDATLSAASCVLRFYAERPWAAQFSDSLPIFRACIFLASRLEEVRAPGKRVQYTLNLVGTENVSEVEVSGQGFLWLERAFDLVSWRRCARWLR